MALLLSRELEGLIPLPDLAALNGTNIFQLLWLLKALELAGYLRAEYLGDKQVVIRIVERPVRMAQVALECEGAELEDM